MTLTELRDELNTLIADGYEDVEVWCNNGVEEQQPVGYVYKTSVSAQRNDDTDELIIFIT